MIQSIPDLISTTLPGCNAVNELALPAHSMNGSHDNMLLRLLATAHCALLTKAQVLLSFRRACGHCCAMITLL